MSLSERRAKSVERWLGHKPMTPFANKVPLVQEYMQLEIDAKSKVRQMRENILSKTRQTSIEHYNGRKTKSPSGIYEWESS